MSVRENVHRIVDTLPEDRLPEVLDYILDMEDPEDPISPETQSAIDEGLDDIRNGRTISLEEYRSTRQL